MPRGHVFPTALRVFYQGAEGIASEVVAGFGTDGEETIVRPLAAPVRTQWIAVSPEAASGGTWTALSITEFAATGESPRRCAPLENRAAGRRMAVAGWRAGPGNALNDGVLFSSGRELIGMFGPVDGSASITVDFGEPVETRSFALVSGIRPDMGNLTRARDVEIAFAEDAAFERVIATRTASAGGGNPLPNMDLQAFDYEPVTAQHVRVRLLAPHDPGGIGVLVNEIVFLDRPLARRGE